MLYHSHILIVVDFGILQRAIAVFDNILRTLNRIHYSIDMDRLFLFHSPCLVLI